MPIMMPTYDHIATVWRMTMIMKVTAFIFELDSYLLPLARFDLTFCLTVWESNLNSLDEITKFVGNHTEKENYTIFIYWFMSQTTEINRIAKGRTIPSPRTANF